MRRAVIYHQRTADLTQHSPDCGAEAMRPHSLHETRRLLMSTLLSGFTLLLMTSTAGADIVPGPLTWDSEKSDRKKTPDAGKNTAHAESTDVPERLSRSMVKSTVAKYQGRLQSCYTDRNRNKMGGRIFVRYTVQPSGRVSAASVTTHKFKGTDVGKCVERVVREMKFPETRNSLTVNYPFELKESEEDDAGDASEDEEPSDGSSDEESSDDERSSDTASKKNESSAIVVVVSVVLGLVMAGITRRGLSFPRFASGGEENVG